MMKRVLLVGLLGGFVLVAWTVVTNGIFRRRFPGRGSRRLWVDRE